jgi:peptidoglycan/LPS O-acetylase OafA/YrhL
MSQNAPLADRNAPLDYLRLVAALAVVGFHYLFRGAAADGYVSEGYPEAAPFAIYGYLGVNLFFLISGYVIAWSAEGRDWRDFAVARFVRLYPGFLICMTISFAVLALVRPPWAEVSLGQYAANLLMFAPALRQPFVDGVYWSIILELMFYGWVAIALMTGVFQRLKLELVAGWLVISALNEYAFGSGALRILLVTEYGPLFAAGILLHHIQTRCRSAEAMVLLAASVALSTSLMGVAQGWMLEHYGVAVATGPLALSNLFIHGLVIAAIALRDFVPATRTALALGGLTYPLYLLHQNIGYVAIDFAAPHVGKWPAMIVATCFMLGLAFAVWKWLETPARKLSAGFLRNLLRQRDTYQSDPRPA